MFTINVYLRFALIVGGIIGGAALWAAYGFWYGFPFLLVGVLLLVGYLLLGTSTACPPPARRTKKVAAPLSPRATTL